MMTREEREAERRAEKFELRGRKYANFLGYTDVEPFEIVKVVSEKTLEIRAMSTVQTKKPTEFHKGGFVGHFADNRSGQEYTYHSNEDAPVVRIRWSERKGTWQSKHGSRFALAEEPYKFYDYNF